LTEGLFELEEAEDEQVRDNLHKRLQVEGREVLYRELKDIDPASAGRIHINDTQRLIRALEIYHKTGKSWSEHLQVQLEPANKFVNLLQLGLTCDRKVLCDRIEQRTLSMFKNGLVEEAKKLQGMGYSINLPSMQALGYRHANNLIAGHWDKLETTRLLIRDTRRYAKRQMTWFSKNQSIHWFERTDHKGVLRDIDDWLRDLK
jgi:tRNA dimethylallyltransferase